MRAIGTVKWFNNAKGYGFIEFDGCDRDVFVHYTSIVEEGYRTLKRGEPVEFVLVESPRGPQAESVVKVASPVPQI